MKTLLRIASICFITVIFSLTAALFTARAQVNPILKDDTTKKYGIGNQNTSQISLADCKVNGNCSVEHILLLANSIIRWAVAISGSIALLMYIIGGVWMIFSQGNSSRIERGKDIIIGTSISLIFILGGWLIIQFALESLGAKDQYNLKPNNCGNDGQCPYGMVCSKSKKCVEHCQVEKAEVDPEHQWQCQSAGDCGCATHPERCVKNKCRSQPSNLDYICCWKP